ncbi:hypothetical protein [Yersinia phage fHe-Yen9-03]|uniref:Uncharacterized protein n=1 Tax=Yersinia phage fHe-Yen9-03 TaxID=2052743 RepID=A0A2C9CY94_9CAUD|nr:hypothetical protein [Yersinia phage fHe-Yen9-03]
MRVQPIQPIIKLANSTVKNEYSKIVVDIPCSTVVSLGSYKSCDLYNSIYKQ